MCSKSTFPHCSRTLANRIVRVIVCVTFKLVCHMQGFLHSTKQVLQCMFWEALHWHMLGRASSLVLAKAINKTVFLSICAGWIPGKTDAKALWTLVTSSWLNLLILVVPVGWAVHFAGLNSILVFCLVSVCCS